MYIRMLDVRTEPQRRNEVDRLMKLFEEKENESLGTVENFD